MNQPIFVVLWLLTFALPGLAQPFQFFDKPQGFGGIALLDNQPPVDFRHQLQVGGALLYGISDFQTFRVSYQYQRPKLQAALAYQTLYNTATRFQWMQAGLSRALGKKITLHAVFQYGHEQTSRLLPQQDLSGIVGLTLKQGAFKISAWSGFHSDENFRQNWQHSGLAVLYATSEERLTLQSSISFGATTTYSSLARLKLSEHWNVSAGYTFAIRSIFWGIGYQNRRYEILVSLDKHPILGFTPKTLLRYAF